MSNLLTKANKYLLIEYSTQDSVATIKLNDPKTLNAFGTIIAEELMDALNISQKDEKVKVIILEGSNGNFSSGGNIHEMISVGLQTDALSQKLETMVKSAGEICRKLREIEKPIIAKLNGTVAGAGFNLALACDFRIASSDTCFIQSFVNIGLVPDAGGIYLLSQMIGIAKTTELTMLGEKLTAQQVFELNLLNQVITEDDKCDNIQVSENQMRALDTAVNTLAMSLVKKPATALSAIKRMINEQVFSELSAALDMEAKHQSLLAKTDEFIEGITAFIEKRPANFTK